MNKAIERQEILSTIARNEDLATSDRIKSIDTLNKMTGEYTLKVDANVKTSRKLDDILNQIGGGGLEDDE